MNKSVFPIPEKARALTPQGLGPIMAGIDSATAPSREEPEEVDVAEEVAKFNKEKDRMVSGLVTEKAPEQQAEESIKPDQNITLSEEPKDAAEKEKKTESCPACGCTLVDNKVEVTYEEKTKWLRHILGEAKFTKDYSMFGGRIRVRFRSRSMAENDAIFNQLTEDIRNEKIPEAPAFASPAYVTTMYRYMLAVSLEKLEKRSPDGKAPSIQVYPDMTNLPLAKDGDTRSAVTRMHDDTIVGMDEGFVAALMATHRRFENLVSELIRHGEDPDFWGPIGVMS
jgi:hypothetical protein